MATSSPGRPRDPGIDSRILEVTRQHLAEDGYSAMSLAAVAAEAGTSRAALYRRWPTKADLATAAIADLADLTAAEVGGDPFADLVAELESFRRGIGRADGVPMVGTMLVGSTDEDLVHSYRERVVEPRRARLRAILERAVSAGELDPDADLDVAVTMCTGSWYARALTGRRPLPDWPRRAASVVWRGLGGTVPSARPGGP